MFTLKHTVNDFEQADHNYLYTPDNLVWFIFYTVVLPKCFRLAVYNENSAKMLDKVKL